MVVRTGFDSKLTGAAARFLNFSKSLNTFGSSVVLDVPNNLSIGDVKLAFAVLIDSHPMLRQSYSYDNNSMDLDGPISSNLGDHRLQINDMSGVKIQRAMVDPFIEIAIRDNTSSLSPERGRMLAVTLFNEEIEGHLACVTIHHLSLDGISWRILVQDLRDCFNQILRNSTPSLQSETTTCVDWVREMTTLANRVPTNQLMYWLDLEHTNPSTIKRGSTSQSILLGTLIGSEANRILKQAPFVYGATPDELLMLTFGIAASQLTDQTTNMLVQSHGRYAHLTPLGDLGRTVGWIADDYPVRVAAAATSSIESLGALVENLPDSPESYFMLKYYSCHSDKFDWRSLPPFYFNYHGDIAAAAQSGLSNIGDLHRSQIGNLGVFSVALQCWVRDTNDGLTLEYSLYTPRKAYSPGELTRIESNWLKLLREM